MFFAAWLLPPIIFVGLERYAFGLQYALFGVLLCLLLKTKLLEANWNPKKLITYLLLFILLVLTQWACDAGLISFLALIAATVFVQSEHKTAKVKLIQTSALLATLLASKITISWMKSLVEVNTDLPYSTGMVSFSELIENLQCLYEKFIWSMTTSSVSPLYSLYVVLGLAGLSFITPKIIKGFRKLNSTSRTIIVFCALDAALLFAAIMVNEWSHQSELPRRYFCGIYASLWFMTLVFLSQQPSRKPRKSSYFIIGMLLLGAVITPLSYRFHEPKTLTSKAELVQEFEQFGPIGIIGNYWNSYDISAFNPTSIKATPHDLDVHRSDEMIGLVFEQPRLFLIKDMWLETFPDSLNQFGYPLQKVGDAIELSNWVICEYEISKTPLLLDNSKLFFNGKRPDAITLVLTENSDDLVVFGPYIELQPGNYSLRPLINSIHHTPGETTEVLFEVSANSGKNSIASVANIDPEYFSEQPLTFNLSEPMNRIEFRLFMNGIDSLNFMGYELYHLNNE